MGDSIGSQLTFYTLLFLFARRTTRQFGNICVTKFRGKLQSGHSKSRNHENLPFLVCEPSERDFSLIG